MIVDTRVRNGGSGHYAILFAVAADNGEQLLGTGRALGVGQPRARDMLLEMIGDHFLDEPGDRAADCRNKMQNFGARRLRLERSLDRANLSADAADARNEFGIIA